MGPRTRRGARPAVSVIVTQVHAVTDERVAAFEDLGARARALARAGASLHARGHDLSGAAHWHLAQLLASTTPRGLFVNDRLEVALALGPVGVVVPERGIPVRHARRLLGPDRVRSRRSRWRQPA